jgi:hypothetical protein
VFFSRLPSRDRKLVEILRVVVPGRLTLDPIATSPLDIRLPQCRQPRIPRPRA